MVTHVPKAAASLRRGPNVRVDPGEKEGLCQLARSYIAQPVHPFVILPDDTIVDGNRRHLGLELIGALDQVVDCLVTAAPIGPEQVLMLQMASAIHRQTLRDPEVYLGSKKLMAAHPEWQRKELADALALDPSMATKILSVDNLTEAARQAFLVGRFGFSVTYLLSKAPPEEQATLLAARLNGARRDELESQSRKSRTGGTPAVKAGRIKIELAGGVTVTFTAQDALDLDQAIEAGAEACKLMKKGQEQGLTARTIQKVSSDRAKAGG
jgi:ParB-like chromosome segregation protein Spo0J